MAIDLRAAHTTQSFEAGTSVPASFRFEAASDAEA